MLVRFLLEGEPGVNRASDSAFKADIINIYGQINFLANNSRCRGAKTSFHHVDPAKNNTIQCLINYYGV